MDGVRSHEKYTKMPQCIAAAQVSGPETDRIGRPYQFFTVGGPIETERTGSDGTDSDTDTETDVVWTAPLIFL